jgi:hypothetical protein
MGGTEGHKEECVVMSAFFMKEKWTEIDSCKKETNSRKRKFPSP